MVISRADFDLGCGLSGVQDCAAVLVSFAFPVLRVGPWTAGVIASGVGSIELGHLCLEFSRVVMRVLQFH